MKYRNHPSIDTVRRFFQHNSMFYFSSVDKNTALKEMKGLNANKAVQDNDNPRQSFERKCKLFAEQIREIATQRCFSKKLF